MRAIHSILLASLAIGVLAAGCNYDPPPDVIEFACEDNRCVLGEPIVLRFSEPVKASSVAVIVWPGEKNTYDLEGRRLDTVQPLLERCGVEDSPCGTNDGVVLTLDCAGVTLSMDAAEGALGPLNRPLVLEIASTLEDDAGRKLNVSRSFDFQVVRERWDPFADTGGGTPDAGGGASDAVDEDVPPPEPLGVMEGPHLFYTVVFVPGLNVDLAQQFFCDIQVNQITGEYFAVMTDSDPKSGAPLNTSKPEELYMDLGVEGFVFLTKGTIQSSATGLIFDSDPFTLELTIGPITFALRDAEIRGSISTEEGTGLSRWDGTMAVRELFLDLPTGPQTHGNRQDNFQIVQLTPEQVPDGLPHVCTENPCAALQGPQCTVPHEDADWPPAGVCPDDDAP